MISEKMLQKLNEQVTKEFYSAYLYLSMEAYFASENLNGFANFFHVQAQEERDHAMKFFNYISHVGGRVKLAPIEGPQTDFVSAREVFQITLDHERQVTQLIYFLVNLAVEEKDHFTNTFLQWFVTEQAEEESSADAILKKLKLIGSDGMGILMLDAELAKRVYTPPVPGTVASGAQA